MSDRILCIGELVWDTLPAGLFLGGAPFNVACHLHALGRRPLFASRVGRDRLGREALRRMTARGLSTELVQTDETLPTGFVEVELEASEEPDYHILQPAAWDAIAHTERLSEDAQKAAALVFGSLAQRATPSRETIEKICDAATLCIFDVNARPPHVTRSVVEESLTAADVLKVNEEELEILQDWYGVDPDREAALPDIAATFECSAVCLTRGPRGAWLWWDDSLYKNSGMSVDVEDPVGAGDAFLAVLISGLLDGCDGDVLLARANRMGASVASRRGAVPPLDPNGENAPPFDEVPRDA